MDREEFAAMIDVAIGETSDVKYELDCLYNIALNGEVFEDADGVEQFVRAEIMGMQYRINQVQNALNALADSANDIEAAIDAYDEANASAAELEGVR